MNTSNLAREHFDNCLIRLTAVHAKANGLEKCKEY